MAKILAVACCVHPSCSHFFIKMRAQKLNLQHSAKTLATRERQQFWRCGFPKGIRPFGAFLPPLLGACQEVASKPEQRGAQLYARQKEKLWKNQISPLAQHERPATQSAKTL
jgi:hypothetical protein